RRPHAEGHGPAGGPGRRGRGRERAGRRGVRLGAARARHAPRPVRPAQAAPVGSRLVTDDLTDVALSGLLPERATRVRELIADVPDFPSPGILFKDITPLLAAAD